MDKKTNWSKENLIEVVNKSLSVSQVLSCLGLKPLGSNYRTFYKYVKLYLISTDHFQGQSYAGKLRKNNRLRNISTYLIENSNLQTKHIKHRIISEGLLEYKCNKCGISSWQGDELVLQLDHKNGINNDHRMDNLQLLCPNCHSQTETYCGRNNRKPSVKNRYCFCGELITRDAKSCRRCLAESRKLKTKIKWPTMSELKELLKTHSYVYIGKLLGCTGNAVKKHMKKRP